MIKVHYLVVVAVVLKIVCGQRAVGDQCTLKSTQAIGECKLFLDCPSAREELQKFNRFPQTCGFQGTQPIVCCPSVETRTPGEVSKRKCREYSRYVFDRKVPPILFIKPEEITRNECGHTVVTLIVGGEPAGRKEFPHMAAIGFEPTPGDIQWYCGGTILSKDYVLTAAHCLGDHAQGDAKWIRVGVTDLTNTSNRQELKISDRIPHPKYISSSHYHDIGILKLEQPIKLNPYARPACLHLNQNIKAQKAIATGWGQTSWGGSTSNNLLKVTIDMYDHAFCNQSYKNQIGRRLERGIDDEIQVCAGSVDEEKDTCQGDSGGPLQIYHVGDAVKCMYDIVGVTSFGKACSNSPGVYVRVSHYIKWIEDIVWP